MTSWQRDGALMHCTEHGQRFDPSEATCTECQANPVIEVVDEIDALEVKPPDGCLDSKQLERWFVSLAKAARRSASTLARKGAEDFHDHGAIAKHRDVAIKAMRAASEIARAREERAYVDAREKRIRDRAMRATRQ